MTPYSLWMPEHGRCEAQPLSCLSCGARNAGTRRSSCSCENAEGIGSSGGCEPSRLP